MIGAVRFGKIQHFQGTSEDEAAYDALEAHWKHVEAGRRAYKLLVHPIYDDTQADCFVFSGSTRKQDQQDILRLEDILSSGEDLPADEYLSSNTSI